MKFTKQFFAAISITLLASPVFAQSQPAFEVASVKPSGPHSVRGSDGGPGSSNPERFLFNAAVLRDLVVKAYGLIDYHDQIAGPKWIDTEQYDIVVKIPPGTSKKTFQLMLQNLLAERFQLVVHHETRQLPVHQLVVGKNGPKLKESLQSTDPELQSTFGPGMHRRLTARQQTMSSFANSLSGSRPAGRIIIDKTGLTGKFDFTLEYDAPDVEAEGPSIFAAIQEQLGLRLVEGKAPFDIVVIDHAEKTPREN